jgi:mRNA interferase MazF
MKQKEIYYADLNPSARSKKMSMVPVVIISGNIMNTKLGMCIVCPLSEDIHYYSGCVVLRKNKINKLKHDAEIITFQIRTITQKRLIKKIGEITDEQLAELKLGLNDILKW